DMPAQLERGNTDAVWIPEPFLSGLLADEENELVAYSFQENDPGMATMVTFTSGELAADDHEMAADSGEAMTEALAPAEEVHEGSREVLVDFIELAQEDADERTMERRDGELNEDQLMDMVERADRYEFIGDAPTAQVLFLDE